MNDELVVSKSFDADFRGEKVSRVRKKTLKQKLMSATKFVDVILGSKESLNITDNSFSPLAKSRMLLCPNHSCMKRITDQNKKCETVNFPSIARPSRFSRFNFPEWFPITKTLSGGIKSSRSKVPTEFARFPPPPPSHSPQIKLQLSFASSIVLFLY